jgi:siroheme synthase
LVQSVRDDVGTTVKYGQIRLIEVEATASALPDHQKCALITANAVIYDRRFAELVAAILPLGGYAEPAPAADHHAIARLLRLALDGWNVVRLAAAPASAADRRSRLGRIAAELLGAGIAAELPVQLVKSTSADGRESRTCLGEFRNALDSFAADGPVMVTFGTRGAAGPSNLSVIVDNGLAG